MKLVSPARQPTQAERISALERRADAHDGMASQVAEMHGAYTALKNINWFVVKVGACIAGVLGIFAAALAVITGIQRLMTGH